MTSGPGDPIFEEPVAFLFTDGSALPSGPADGKCTSPTLIERYQKALWGLALDQFQTDFPFI